MATETEIERLVTRLVGDASQLQAELNRAKGDIVKFAQEVEQQTKADRATNDAIAKAARIKESIKTAAERYGQALAELQELQQKGLLTQEEYNKAVQKLGPAVDEISDKAKQLGGTLLMVGGAMSAAFGATTMSGLINAGKFEQTNIAFETMIGTVEETKKTLEDLTEFAALTPFEMPEIEQAARGLIQFGERGDQMMQTLEDLGNAAAGTSTDFGMIALIFNQIRGVGKLLTQDFRQLSTRGVLSLADIAKHFKVTTEEAQAMLSAGKISFEDVRAIFHSLSQEGGRFENLMERQSTSLLGLWSTYKDAVGITTREIGQNMLPVAKAVVTTMIQLTEMFRNAPPWVKTFAAAILAVGTAMGMVLTTMGAKILMGAKLKLFYSAMKGEVTKLIATLVSYNVTLTATHMLMLGIVGVGIGVALAVIVPIVMRLNARLEEFNKNLDRMRKKAKKELETVRDEFRKTLDVLNNIKDPEKKESAIKKRLESDRAAAQATYEAIQTAQHALDAVESKTAAQVTLTDTEEAVKKMSAALGVSAKELEKFEYAHEKQFYLASVLEARKEEYAQQQAQLKELTALQESLNDALSEEQRVAKQSMDEWVKGQEKKLEQLGMTEEQILRNQMAELGYTKTEIDRAISVGRVIEDYTKQQKEAADAAKQAAKDKEEAAKEAAKAEEKAAEEAADAKKKALEDVQAMVIANDPVAAYKKTMADLRKLKSVGAFAGHEKIYDMEAKKAAKQLNDDLTELAKKSKIDVQVQFGGNEAIRKGSAEFNRMLMDMGVEGNTLKLKAKIDKDAEAVIAEEERASRKPDTSHDYGADIDPLYSIHRTGGMSTTTDYSGAWRRDPAGILLAPLQGIQTAVESMAKNTTIVENPDLGA